MFNQSGFALKRPESHTKRNALNGSDGLIFMALTSPMVGDEALDAHLENL